MRRSDNYDQELSEKLQSKRFAQAYILGLMEDDDGMLVEDALSHAIVRMGIKEVSDSAGIPTSNIHEFLKGKRKLKPESLDLYLKTFGLKTKIVLLKAS